MIRSWYRNHLVPRVVFIPFWIMRLVLIPLGLIRQILVRRDSDSPSTTLCIEAGVRGWDLIEYKELYESACEYLGKSHVHKIQINRDNDYLMQVKRALDDIRPTHYVYDPRTGSQKWITGLWQSSKISVLLNTRGITPICILTDLPVRSWRAQCAVVSARTGIVTSLMSPRKIHPIFPHGRLVAPSLMPLSEATMDFLNEISQKRIETKPPTAVFVGSLYEPRTSILREISEGLEARGFTLEINGRELGSPKSSDFDYWSRLSNAALIVTTADQIAESGTDWTWFPHLIYRYIEVTACGTLLVAPEVPGVQRFFTPGEHFVSFTSPAHAIDVIEYYLTNKKERKTIAQRGKARAQALIRARAFWTGVDIGLGKNSLT
jgi:hypothetical protein